MIEPRNCFGSAYDVALIGEGPDPDRDLEGEVRREEDLQADEPRSGANQSSRRIAVCVVGQPNESV